MTPITCKCSALTLLAFAFAFASAWAGAEPITLDQAQSLYKQSSIKEENTPDTATQAIQHQKNVAAQARVQALFDTALGVGVKAGLSWQLGNIRKAVVKYTRELDTLYDFERLMIRDQVVPPVITEARDLYHQDGDKTLRLSGAFYRIESQARFSSNAPNWRGYLTFPEPDMSNAGTFVTLRPRNDGEEHIWRMAVTDGWKQGVEQANLLLRHGFDRLNRDFTGMLRFHIFVTQGRITLPVIASERIPVTKKGDTMAIDEKLLRITKLPDFDPDMAKWRSVIRPTQD